ncbi:MAG: carbohydrate ABC transporter permease [Clostridiales bacterium]|nr:carbohydrate ABC transporter permease [Clostridiales bacterium]
MSGKKLLSGSADALIIAFLLFISAAMLIPLLNVLCLSLEPNYIAIEPSRLHIIPREITLKAYAEIIKKGQIIISFRNSVFITVLGSLSGTLLTAMMSYGLCDANVKGIKFISYLILFTMMFSGGVIPMYMLIKNLGLMNNLMALVLPSIMSAYNVILMRSFFKSLPDSLSDSAKIDGCNEARVFWRIILPISKPIIATILLFYAVARWNAYFDGAMYITDRNKKPMQVILRELLILSDSPDTSGDLDIGMNVKMAIAFVTIVPILCVYPFLQKYFTQGILLGSIKG